MEYNDLTDEQKAKVDQRVEAEVAKYDQQNPMGPRIDYFGEGGAGTVSPKDYGIPEDKDPEIAALQAETQKVTGKAAPQRPKAERWYLSPGQKPMGDPEQYRNIGGATPIEEQPEPTQGADGKWRTAFGGKVRVTDKDGNTSWEDINGQAIEKPKSMQMMEAMNRGFSPNRGTAKTWEDAIRQQQSERDNKSFAIAQQKADANNAALVSRKKRKIAQNLKVADNIGGASANLQKNLAEVQQHIKSGGGIEDSGAVMSKQGTTKGNYYVFGIVEPSQMDDFNKSMAKLGVKDSMQKIVVSQQVDKYGNPVGEPIFAVQYMKGGNLGNGEGLYTKKLTLSEALNAVAKAHKADGRDPKLLNDYLSGVFGDENAAKYGYKRGLSEKERIAQMGADSRANVAQINAQGRVDSAKLAAELKRMGYDIDEKKLEESRRHHEMQEKNEQARIASDQEKAERATRTRVGTMINPVTGQPVNPEVLDELKGDLDKSKKAKEPKPDPSPKPASSGDNTGKASMGFEKGKVYTDKTGRKMRYLGGDAHDKKNWEAVSEE